MHYILPGRCKLKPQWEHTEHLLEWPKPGQLTVPHANEDMEQLELLIHNGGWRVVVQQSSFLVFTLSWTTGSYTPMLKTCAWILITSLVCIQTQRHQSYPSTDEWILRRVQKMECSSALKRTELSSCEGQGRILDALSNGETDLWQICHSRADRLNELTAVCFKG